MSRLTRTLIGLDLLSSAGLLEHFGDDATAHNELSQTAPPNLTPVQLEQLQKTLEFLSRQQRKVEERERRRRQTRAHNRAKNKRARAARRRNRG